jgi:hypothetical protein
LSLFYFCRQRLKLQRSLPGKIGTPLHTILF